MKNIHKERETQKSEHETSEKRKISMMKVKLSILYAGIILSQLHLFAVRLELSGSLRFRFRSEQAWEAYRGGNEISSHYSPKHCC